MPTEFWIIKIINSKIVISPDYVKRADELLSIFRQQSYFYFMFSFN